MEREIKFRVWDNVSYMSKPFKLKDVNAWIEFTDEAIVMQYLGIKDKNGVERCEGDIVKTKHQSKAKIVWHNEYACFCYETIDEEVKGEYLYTFKDEEVEVIGNIHQNPELI